jgi:hypothetical protein
VLFLTSKTEHEADAVSQTQVLVPFYWCLEAFLSAYIYNHELDITFIWLCLVTLERSVCYVSVPPIHMAYGKLVWFLPVLSFGSCAGVGVFC